jgi:hypothetical protein
MMRSFIRAIAAMMILSSSASAQNPPTITLRCIGTETNHLGGGVDKIDIGVTVDFQAMQVIGLTLGPLPIVGVNDNTITISYFNRNKTMQSGKTIEMVQSVDGDIDRISGAIQLTSTTYLNGKAGINFSYNLACKPGQRLF